MLIRVRGAIRGRGCLTESDQVFLLFVVTLFERGRFCSSFRAEPYRICEHPVCVSRTSCCLPAKFRSGRAYGAIRSVGSPESGQSNALDTNRLSSRRSAFQVGHYVERSRSAFLCAKDRVTDVLSVGSQRASPTSARLTLRRGSADSIRGVTCRCLRGGGRVCLGLMRFDDLRAQAVRELIWPRQTSMTNE